MKILALFEVDFNALKINQLQIWHKNTIAGRPSWKMK